MSIAHKDRKEQCPKIDWTVIILWYQYVPGTFSVSFSGLLAMKLCFFVSYSLCLAFCLCSSIGVFYTNLEVIKLVFLEIKSRYDCYIFANFILTFETKI